MNKIQLFRRRYIPDEIKELKDDIVLSADDKMILTKWNVLKPRKDIARGSKNSINEFIVLFSLCYKHFPIS